MTEAEIVRCRVRAEDVINGFSCAKITHAKDVIRLANELLAANRKMERMQDLDKASGDFGSIFDNLMKGKKP